MEILKNKYSARLFEEWKKYGKIIIASDFDSTLCPYAGVADVDNQEDIDRWIDLLKKCQETGCFLIIHTACREDRYEFIIEYCKGKGINVDTINKTPMDMPFGKSGSKPYANIFVDDRAGFNEAMDILESALYQYRGYLEQEKLGSLEEIA